MKKFAIMFAIILGLCAGQDCVFLVPPPEPDAPNQADITNWDFSPCWQSWEAFDTCKSLLTHNQEVITGGHSFLDVLFYNIELNLPDSQPSQ